MKIRTGFVTNSSSSSFVIAYKNQNYDNDTLSKFPELKSYYRFIQNLIDVSEGYDTHPGEVIRNIDELKNHFVELCGSADEEKLEDEGLLELSHELTDYINRGYSIMFKDIGYDDSSLCQILTGLADKENFVILSSE